MQRGRKSAAALSVVATIPGQRPEPIDGLTPEQADVWRANVGRMPAEWFTPETWDMLAQLCRHVCYARSLAGELNGFDQQWLKDPAGVDRFDKLTKMHEREGRAITALARNLRLTHQSRYDPAKANTAVKNAVIRKPWE